ncbi:PIN domain-containing protein [Streptomyces sp. DSM 41931]|uniref:PIN domain-containing protein n=1 Tax=Streptomyces sp. DSM 41931 TaxID=3418367 RepID=UPI003D02A035
MEDYKEAVKSYLIVLDTNVLLELYRFTPQARNELLDVLEQLGQRLWVPHQVVSEYHKRRFTAVREHLDLYSTVPDTLSTLRNKALQEVRTLAKRCSMGDDDKRLLTDPIEEAFNRVEAEVRRHSDAFDLSLAKVVRNDPVLSSLARILDGKTGDPFSDEDSSALISSFQERVAEQVPPGYRDAGKTENAHGDYFVWEQLLREAALRQTPVLLVTNDIKDDWVKKEAGLVVGARPELLAEFRERCAQDLLMTQLPQFLGMAKEVLGASVSQSTMQQAKNVRDALSQSSVSVVLPIAHFRRLYNAIVARYDDFDTPSDGSLSAEDELAAEETRRLLKAMRTRRRTRGGDVAIAIPAACFDRFQHFVSMVQNAAEESEDSAPEREGEPNQYRALVDELFELKGLLQAARRERDMAKEMVVVSERAARGIDPSASDEERDRLVKEAQEGRQRLVATAASVHDLEMQISALRKALDIH